LLAKLVEVEVEVEVLEVAEEVEEVLVEEVAVGVLVVGQAVLAVPPSDFFHSYARSHAVDSA